MKALVWYRLDRPFASGTSVAHVHMCTRWIQISRSSLQRYINFSTAGYAMHILSSRAPDAGRFRSCSFVVVMLLGWGGSHIARDAG